MHARAGQGSIPRLRWPSSVKLWQARFLGQGPIDAKPFLQGHFSKSRYVAVACKTFCPSGNRCLFLALDGVEKSFGSSNPAAAELWAFLEEVGRWMLQSAEVTPEGFDVRLVELLV